jgi:glutamate racemase
MAEESENPAPLYTGLPTACYNARMDNRPIGIFDSGVGGLTVAKEIYRILPHESTIYLGDTARIPYGPRSRQTIIKFSRQLASYLISQNVKAIAVACSTATAQALTTLITEFPIPFLGVIAPASREAVKISKSKRIGIIGTVGTIKSRTFEKTLLDLDPHLILESHACPLFVPMIEEGLTDSTILDLIIHYYLDIFTQKKIDTLILGCTHYPVIAPTIQKVVGPHISLINPGISFADSLKLLLRKHSLETSSQIPGKHRYLTTDDPANFLAVARRFLGHQIHGQTRQITLE